MQACRVGAQIAKWCTRRFEPVAFGFGGQRVVRATEHKRSDLAGNA
jgi:hypothetical protein